MKTFSKDNLCLLVGANIRRIRLANHTTIEQLAFELGIEYTQLSRIERGKINTSVYQVFIISRALKVPIADLFGQVQSQVLE
jgi:transcriptional regulator with XRE-family HTH domain